MIVPQVGPEHYGATVSLETKEQGGNRKAFRSLFCLNCLPQFSLEIAFCREAILDSVQHLEASNYQSK